MLKVATIILIIVLAYAGVYGIMLIFSPNVVIKSSFEAATGEKLEDIQNADYLKIMLDEMRHLGIFTLTIVISAFFFLFVGFRKAEKWAWWAMLVVGVIAWGYGLIMNLVTGDMFNTLLHLIGIVIFLVGLLIPVKIFFAKKA